MSKMQSGGALEGGGGGKVKLGAGITNQQSPPMSGGVGGAGGGVTSSSLTPNAAGPVGRVREGQMPQPGQMPRQSPAIGPTISGGNWSDADYATNSNYPNPSGNNSVGGGGGSGAYGTTSVAGGSPGRGQGGVGNVASNGGSGTFSPPRTTGLAGNRSSDTSLYSSDPGLLMSPGRDQVALHSQSAIRESNTAMGYR